MIDRKMRQLHIIALLVLIVGALTALAFVFVFSPKERNRIDGSSLQDFSDRWVLKNYGGDGDELISLPKKLKVKKGDTVTIMNRVPENVHEDSVIMFDSEFQNIMVLLNDERIYSYGVMNEQGHMKNAVPCIHVVDIGMAKPGDVITIYITSDYKKYSGKIPSIYFGSKGAVTTDIITKNGVRFVLGITLLLVIMLLFLALILAQGIRVDKPKAYFALGFSLVAVLWTLTGNDIMQLFVGNVFGLYMIHSILLLMLPIFYMLYQRAIATKKRYGSIFEISIYVYAVNMLTGIVFQLLSVCDFASYIRFTNVLIFLGLGLATFMLYAAKETKTDRMLQSSLRANLILLCACVLEQVLSLFKFYSLYRGFVLAIGLYLYLVLFLVGIERIMIGEINQQKNTAYSLIGTEKKRMMKDLNMGLVYNSLNQVIGELKEKDPAASRLIYDTSIYLKNNMNTINHKEMVPFTQELAYIRAYAGMVQREHQGLTVVIEDKVVEFEVPYNTIEPLVENAVINGALKSESDSRVVVRSYERLDCFAIQIVDNGTGVGPDKRFKGKQTYKEIKKRLKETCGAGIEINNKPGKGTIVTVKVPKEGYIIKE